MSSHYFRGITLFELGRYREAVTEFTADLSEEPHSANALAMRAATWLNLKRTRNAARDAADALREEPELAYAHYVVSYVRSHQQRVGAAESAIREALRIAPSPLFYCRLAELQFERNRFTDCCSATELALLLDPTHVPSLLLRARSLSALGKQEEARDCLHDALALHPNSPATHHALGNVTLQTGESHDARTFLQEARRLNPIAHNDRDALAMAYGRLLWPFRAIDRYLVRFHTWPVTHRWWFLTGTTAILLSISFLLSSYSFFITLPLFLVLLNWLAMPMTTGMLATVVGKLAFRKDLDIAWYHLIPEPARFVFPLVVHCVISVIALIGALLPMFALLFFGFIPHFELFLIFMRKLTLLEAIGFAVTGLFGIVMPIAIGFVFLDRVFLSPFAALFCWMLSLPLSYFLTVFRQ